MTTSGYDSIDNANGVLIKSAGYPAGFSSVTAFGTISFSAKKAGSGTIKVGNSSLAFQASGQSAIAGSGTTFAVTMPVAPAPIPTPLPTPTVKTPAKTPSVVSPTTSVAPVQPVTQIFPSSQTAAAVATLSGGNVWLWILIVILVIALVAYVSYRLGSQRRKRLP